MVISIFSNYQQQQISVHAQQVVKILRRSDGGKSIKMSFKNVRYSVQKTVSNHLKTEIQVRNDLIFLVERCIFATTSDYNVLILRTCTRR